MHPIKLDNIYNQTELSSQFGFNTVSLTNQSGISSKITIICTKTQFRRLFDYKTSKKIYWYSLDQNKLLLKLRQHDQLLFPLCQDKINIC